MLHLREGKYPVGQVQQMQALPLQQVEVLALAFGLVVQAATAQVPRRHQQGADGCLHVVHHGVGEVLTHLRQFILPLDDVHLLEDAESQQEEACHRAQQVVELRPDGFGTKVEEAGPHALQAVQRDDERAPMLQLPFVVVEVAQGGAEHHGRVARQLHRVQPEAEAAQPALAQLLAEEGVEPGLGAEGVAVVGAAPGLVDGARHPLAVEPQAHARPAAEEEDGYGGGHEGEEDVVGLAHVCSG